MAATGEFDNTVAFEAPAPENPVAKAAKEMKPKALKKKKPYFEMIKEAILALDEENGSSPHAIAKFMEEKHKEVLPENFRKILRLQLKNSLSKGKLIKIKASYKLSDAGKKPVEAKAAKKPEPEPVRRSALAATATGGPWPAEKKPKKRQAKKGAAA